MVVAAAAARGVMPCCRQAGMVRQSSNESVEWLPRTCHVEGRGVVYLRCAGVLCGCCGAGRVDAEHGLERLHLDPHGLLLPTLLGRCLLHGDLLPGPLHLPLQHQLLLLPLLPVVAGQGGQEAAVHDGRRRRRGRGRGQLVVLDLQAEGKGEGG